MAGLILNLASLKNKADTAGVANTANNTTPNLCPQKSAIAGYVTNGTSVVKISGTWSNNQLVEDAYVSVNKIITGTQTVYRNVNVGSLQGGTDIPAGGGSSYAYKVVTYEYATKTTYSDGSSVTTNYASASYTVYGSTISASSLGTTTKSRTKIGTSSKTETVANTSVSVSKDIYQQANAVTATTTLYSDHSLGNSSASDIPAGGGSISAQAYVSYKYWTRTYYTSESYKDGSKTSTGSYIYGEGVTANSLSTTMKVRTSTGKTSTPSGTVGGQAFTGTAVTIYQAANYITSIQATTSENVSTHVIYDNMPASGGTVNPQGTARCTYTFKSGATDTNGSTSPFTGVITTYTRSYSEYSDSSNVFSVNTNTGAVTAGANTSTANTRTVTVKAILTVSVSYSSTFSSLTKPSSSTITHYPTCIQNKADAPTVTGGSLYFSGSIPGDIPATGGSNSIPSITQCIWITTYSDGSTNASNVPISSVTWSYGKYTVNSTYYDSSHPPGYTLPTYYTSSTYGQFSFGQNSGSRHLKGWTFIKGVYNGSTNYLRREVWQAAGSEDYAINASYSIDNIPYYGGTCIKPSLINIVLYHIVNGSPTSQISLSQNDLQIVGYANNNTGIAPTNDSSYTTTGYKYTMPLNAASSQQTGNYIFTRFKYTPSGWSQLIYTYKKQVKQDANPETGFILTINNPESAVPNPVVHLCYGNNDIKYTCGAFLQQQYTVPQNWIDNWTGPIQKIALTRVTNTPAHISDYVYLRIIGYTESGTYVNILQKTNISTWFHGGDTSDFMSLTNTFNASDFNSGMSARIIFTFTKT